jgi:hypothetical protein
VEVENRVEEKNGEGTQLNESLKLKLLLFDGSCCAHDAANRNGFKPWAGLYDGLIVGDY